MAPAEYSPPGGPTTGSPSPRRGWLKLAVSGAICTAILAFVAFTAGESAGMFRWVSEINPHDASLQGKRMWVAGILVPESHAFRSVRGQREEHTFTLEHKGKSLQVRYLGPIPPGMKPGRELIVRGKLATGGKFHADTVTTKCPSKYKSRYEAGR